MMGDADPNAPSFSVLRGMVYRHGVLAARMSRFLLLFARTRPCVAKRRNQTINRE